MSERPLPRSWKERLRERLAEASKVSSRLTVVPKRNSGPHIAGDRWHLPAAQAEMVATRCQFCRVDEATVYVKVCETCNGLMHAPKIEAEAVPDQLPPPSAA
jgi:hypothetical protein